MTDLNPNVAGGVDALTLVAGMAGKPIAETLFSKFVGNGTMISGAAKIASAVMINKFIPGKVGNVAAIAIGADGAEDIIVSFSSKKTNTSTGVDF